MNSENKSTLTFKSNLQLVHGNYRDDPAFCQSVHDIFALEFMVNAGYKLSPLQLQEYNNASLHCTYAYKDDFPFGTVQNRDGEKQVVCRCTNTSCKLFESCRPDFDVSELSIDEENTSFATQIANIDDSYLEYKTLSDDIKKGDKAAAASLFSGITDKEEKNTSENEQTIDSNTCCDDLFEEKTDAVATVQSVPDATFSSFVETTQDQIIRLPSEDRTIVNAGPGTGKTWTLIEKIKYMMTSLEVDPSDILVLCFSKAAVEVIKNRLQTAAEHDELPLNWQQLDVRTFDSFSTYLLAWVQDNIPHLLPKHFILEGMSYDNRIRHASTILKKRDDLLSEYRHLIVDEVQDLVGVRAELVLSLINSLSDNCGFTLLGDSCQALYDYLAVDDASVISSEDFYKTIMHDYKNAHFYSLNRNYRQGDEFGQLTIPYRNAILSEEASILASEAKKLNSIIDTSTLKLKEISQNDINELLKNGSVGILSRTNGQALQISSWFRSEGIPHSLQRPIRSQSLASWIADIILNAETDVIDRSEFDELFIKLFPYAANYSGRYWEALVSTQPDQSKTHFEIEDILRGIFQNARNPLLFEEPTKNKNNITISNIHRAKGREFDSVLVLQDVLENMTDEEKSDLLEHKVCYVALTRPKKRVEKVLLKTQYIYISKDEIRRCFKSGGYQRKYLSHFEVGDGFDFNNRSYAKSNGIQDYIKAMQPDSRLKLIKCPETASSYVLYEVVPEDDEQMVLGYTTSYFAQSMERAIQRIFSNPHTIAYKYYPSIFGDVYLDGLTTCVSPSDTGIKGARKYGGMNIWYGLSISGFAQMEKDRY